MLIASDYLDAKLQNITDESLRYRIRASVHILFYSIISGEGDQDNAAVLSGEDIGELLVAALESVWIYQRINGIGQSPEDLAAKGKCMNRIYSFRFRGNRNIRTATIFYHSCIKLYGLVRNIMDGKDAFSYAYAGLPAFYYLEEIGEMDDYPGLADIAVMHVQHAIAETENRTECNEELKIARRLFRKAGRAISEQYKDYLDIITMFLGIEVF